MEGHVVGAGEVSAGFIATGLLSAAAVRRVVRKNTLLLNTKVKGKASGRPGPNAPTGDYRRSIGFEFVEAGELTTGIVGTNLPQGRRLELGFTGSDSLGRVYDQPAYPHFAPALAEQEPLFMQDLEREINKETK
jgi:hypothetical protein